MGIGFRELIVILLIVLVIFGAKKLRSIGSDLGSAVRNFRTSMKEGEQDARRGTDQDDDKTVRDDSMDLRK